MNPVNRRFSGPVMLSLSLVFAGGMPASAQQADSTPPKVLEVTREFVKPGKGGAQHDKSESAFVQAMIRTKEPVHYFALSSLSGKSRALYLTGYDSFAAWQKDNDAIDKNAALSAELDRDSAADGELLSDIDQFVFTYDADASYRANGDMSNARYVEVSSFNIKPGHMKEFTDLAKQVIEIHKKAGTSAHWAAYDIAYGGDNMVVILSADKSMADIDTGFAENKTFEAAAGDDGMKKIDEMFASCVESSDGELFSINPKQSYPPGEWVKANPDFWNPKPTAPPTAKPASAKPAAAPAAQPAAQTPAAKKPNP